MSASTEIPRAGRIPTLGNQLRYHSVKAYLAAQGTDLPGYVEEEFEDYLKCGHLEHGFLRVRCGTCHAEHLNAGLSPAKLTQHHRATIPSCRLIQQFATHTREYAIESRCSLFRDPQVKTVPYVPLSHPFIERLIGTLRREFLYHVFFWNANDLERKLEGFRQYYNAHRVHTSLDGDTPSEIAAETTRRRADLNQFQWKSHCRGLFQLPVAA